MTANELMLEIKDVANMVKDASHAARKLYKKITPFEYNSANSYIINYALFDFLRALDDIETKLNDVFVMLDNMGINIAIAIDAKGKTDPWLTNVLDMINDVQKLRSLIKEESNETER